MTLLVKSSWSCTLKEIHLCEDREREREADRNDCAWKEGVLREEGRDEDKSDVMAGRRRKSFTETAQILLTSSRVAI